MAKAGNVTVVFQEPRRVILEDRPIPQPESGQFLVKTRRSLISTGTELSILSGEARSDSVWGRLSKFPSPVGYSNVGEVIEVGEGLKEEWVGRRVATYRRGYHAQYIVGSPDDSPVIPPEVPDDQATFFALAAIAMNGVRKGRVRWGEAVVVYGLGIVGQLALRFCHFAGAELVVGIDIAEPRIAYLPDSPRIRGINPADCDPRKYMQELNRGRLADVVFEVTGNPDIIPEEFHVLRRQGRFVVLSSPRDNTTFDFHDLCNWPSFQIIGAHASSHPPVSTPQNPWTKERHAQLFFGLIADGELDIESLISHRESYEKAPELYNMLLEDRSRAMGVVLEW